eukprot:1161322-Pelagomonas_calceolata.AAC.6
MGMGWSSAGSCARPVTSEECRACCATHGVRRKRRKKKEWGCGDCTPMSVLTKLAPRGLLLRALMIDELEEDRKGLRHATLICVQTMQQKDVQLLLRQDKKLQEQQKITWFSSSNSTEPHKSQRGECPCQREVSTLNLRACNLKHATFHCMCLPKSM